MAGGEGSDECGLYHQNLGQSPDPLTVNQICSSSPQEHQEDKDTGSKDYVTRIMQAEDAQNELEEIHSENPVLHGHEPHTRNEFSQAMAQQYTQEQLEQQVQTLIPNLEPQTSAEGQDRSRDGRLMEAECRCECSCDCYEALQCYHQFDECMGLCVCEQECTEFTAEELEMLCKCSGGTASSLCHCDVAQPLCNCNASAPIAREHLQQRQLEEIEEPEDEEEQPQLGLCCCDGTTPVVQPLFALHCCGCGVQLCAEKMTTDPTEKMSERINPSRESAPSDIPTDNTFHCIKPLPRSPQLTESISTRHEQNIEQSALEESAEHNIAIPGNAEQPNQSASRLRETVLNLSDTLLNKTTHFDTVDKPKLVSETPVNILIAKSQIPNEANLPEQAEVNFAEQCIPSLTNCSIHAICQQNKINCNAAGNFSNDVSNRLDNAWINYPTANEEPNSIAENLSGGQDGVDCDVIRNNDIFLVNSNVENDFNAINNNNLRIDVDDTSNSIASDVINGRTSNSIPAPPPLPPLHFPAALVALPEHNVGPAEEIKINKSNLPSNSAHRNQNINSDNLEGSRGTNDLYDQHSINVHRDTSRNINTPLTLLRVMSCSDGSDQDTQLHEAARSGQTDLLARLLDKDASKRNLNARAMPFMATPLREAVVGKE